MNSAASQIIGQQVCASLIAKPAVAVAFLCSAVAKGVVCLKPPPCRALAVTLSCCRAIAQANITREYLHSLVQDGYKMPAGPVIISPHGLLPSLYR
jgi:hypothetical protein